MAQPHEVAQAGQPAEADKAAAAAPAQPAQASEQTGVPEILQAGQVVKDYEIIKPLGKGKFSIVYMAKRISDGVLCALKKINIFDMMDPKQRDKCLKEVKLLQSLDHPNIVRFLDASMDQNELHIIVEWAEKGDLKRLIRRAVQNDICFTEGQIWDYGKQLAGALDHMHKRRVMHRDLKPANIFVASDGSLKLGDLGLGRFFSSQTLEAFSKVGTPLYMSPEVLRGAGYDMRSDVWSLGCVFYELAMRRSPFKSDTQLSLYDLFVKINKGQYPPLPETYSSEFRQLIDGMLQLEPSKRLDCDQVLQICISQTTPAPLADGKRASSSQSASRTFRPAPLLVMEDVCEKLKLLEYEDKFLRPTGFPTLHRCFFTQKLPPVKIRPPRCKTMGIQEATQFQVMFELISWVLHTQVSHEAFAPADASAGPCAVPQSGLGAGDAAAGSGAGDAAAGSTSSKVALAKWMPTGAAFQEDVNELTKRLVSDLKRNGINISSDMTIQQLRDGYGEGVCLILNELINQELVRRDFHFQAPCWDSTMDDQVLEIDEEEDGLDESSAGSDAQSGSKEGRSGLFDDTLEFSTAFETATHEPTVEPIHVANVNSAEWAEELKRVTPLLKIKMDATQAGSDWSCAITSVKQLCEDIEKAGSVTSISTSIKTLAMKWREELSRLRRHEDHLNDLFVPQREEMQQLRETHEEACEHLRVLQDHVAELSESYGIESRKADDAKAEVADKGEAVHDSQQLQQIKRKLQRIRNESKDLGIHLGLLKVELFTRQQKRTSSLETSESKPN